MLKFTDVLGEFSEKLGLGALKPDADGSIAFLFDDRYEITFTPDKDDGSLLMYCEMEDADRLEKPDLCRLMEASVLGARTGGAAFGILGSLNRLVLWKRYDDRFEDVSDLERKVNEFLPQIIYWKEHLGDSNASGETAAASSGDDGDYGFGGFGNMSV